MSSLCYQYIILTKQGIFTLGNTEYIGRWKEDKQHGKGRMTYATGDVYIGQWANGLPSMYKAQVGGNLQNLAFWRASIACRHKFNLLQMVKVNFACPMVLGTLEHGSKELEKGWENANGPMEINMKACGLATGSPARDECPQLPELIIEVCFIVVMFLNTILLLT